MDLLKFKKQKKIKILLKERARNRSLICLQVVNISKIKQAIEEEVYQRAKIRDQSLKDRRKCKNDSSSLNL